MTLEKEEECPRDKSDKDSAGQVTEEVLMSVVLRKMFSFSLHQIQFLDLWGKDNVWICKIQTNKKAYFVWTKVESKDKHQTTEKLTFIKFEL